MTTFKNFFISACYQYVIASCSDNQVRIQNLNTGECLCEVKFNTKNSEDQLGINMSNSIWSSILCQCCAEGEEATQFNIGVYNWYDELVTQEKNCLKNIQLSKSTQDLLIMQGENFCEICISNCAKFAVLGQTNGLVTYWDLNKRLKIGQLFNHKDKIVALTISSCGNFTVTADETGLVNQWSLKHYKLLKEIKTGNVPIFNVQLSWGGHFCTTTSHDGNIQIYKFQIDGNNSLDQREQKQFADLNNRRLSTDMLANYMIVDNYDSTVIFKLYI